MKAGDDEAKYWLVPIAMAANYGFNGSELNEVQQLVEEHRELLVEAWNEYLG